MPQPSEAYREGYEKGRSDNVGGRLAEITMGMLRDDPGGYYAAGYYDGAGGRKFNVHGSKDSAKRSRKPLTPSLPSPLESQWYQLCDASEFIPKETVDRCVAILHAAGSQVAAIIGLSAFTNHTCPRCGKSGHFRIHFLGRLRHPGACGWEGYMKTGSYIGHQIAQIFHTGVRAAGAMEDEADKKGKERNWMHSVLGFLVVAIFRAAAAVVLIPLHCVAVLSQPGQKRADITTPLITLAVIMTGIGIGIYELQQASRPQFPASQQYFPPPQVSTPTQAPVVQTPASQITPGSNSSIASQAPAQPGTVTFTETFNNAPDSSNNWIQGTAYGAPVITYTPGNMRIQAAPTSGQGTSVGFLSKRRWIGDLDFIVELDHQGYGRTSIGIASVLNGGVIGVALDTDDTNYLNLTSVSHSTEWKYAGTAYMNRWIALRIQVVGFGARENLPAPACQK